LKGLCPLLPSEGKILQYNLPLTESICNCEEFLHSIFLQLVFTKLKLLYTIRKKAYFAIFSLALSVSKRADFIFSLAADTNVPY